jgi:hypothetical protein
MTIEFKTTLKPKKKRDDFWDSKVMRRATATENAFKAKKRPRPRIVRVKIRDIIIAEKSFTTK